MPSFKRLMMYYECWLILTDSQSIGFLNHTDMDVSSKPVNVQRVAGIPLKTRARNFVSTHAELFCCFWFLVHIKMQCLLFRGSICSLPPTFFSFFLDMIFFWDGISFRTQHIFQQNSPASPGVHKGWWYRCRGWRAPFGSRGRQGHGGTLYRWMAAEVWDTTGTLGWMSLLM